MPVSLSVIVPYFRKLDELRLVLPHNAQYLGRPDVELVLVLDEPSQEAEVLALLAQFPFLQSRVLVNDQPHDWRPPSAAINVGVRHARGRFVLVMSPESVLVDDGPSRVLEVMSRHPDDVLVGRVAWATFAESRQHRLSWLFAEAYRQSALPSYHRDYYGSLAVSRRRLASVGGFKEGLTGWGGEDDNLRVRLAKAGALIMLDRQLKLLHLSDDRTIGVNKGVARHTTEEMRALVHPQQARANPDGWGEAFSRIARDWRPAADELPPTVDVAGDEGLAAALAPAGGPRLLVGTTARGHGRAPHVVALFSFRYDAHLVPALVQNIAPAVDAWIGYDDRAAPELLSNERYRRRILALKARELGARWVLTVDPDERFEQALADRIGALTSEARRCAWNFQLREMFATDRYRVDGRWGSKWQPRLFPLLGDYRVGSAELHTPICEHYPKRATGLNLYHLKMITPERRRARSALYRRLDPDQRRQEAGYDYLADDSGAVLEDIPSGRGYHPPHREDGGLWMPQLG